jgi:uncharacterized membrane protein YfcA
MALNGQTVALLTGAAFLAGVVNAVAGGGSFLTLPALIFVGVPPIMANATSALAVSPGYLGSTLGFKAELRALPLTRLRREMALSALGGIAGALLLLSTPAKLFSGIVPWLLLFATALFALGPSLTRYNARMGHAPHQVACWRNIGLLAASIYGGYFNGGLGILLMALYSATGESHIHTANALKSLNSLVLSWLSVAAFVLAGAIAWQEGMLMMLAATVGGFWGARWARRLPVLGVRWAVICMGLIMSLMFFLRTR